MIGTSRSPALARVAYGVDGRADGLRAVRAERRGGRVRLEPVTPGDSRWQADLSRGVPVVAALGPRECITHWVQAPFGSAAKARKVLPTLLDIQLPFPLESCAYAFPVQHRTLEGGQRALGAAARGQDLDARLAALATVGIDPAVLDPEGLALWTQSLAEAPGPAPMAPAPLRAVLNLEAQRGTLVLGVGAEYGAAHSVSLESVEDWRRLVRAVGGEAPTGMDWWLTGAGAADAAVVESLRSRLTAAFPEARVAVHRDPATFLARALAVRAVTEGPWRCNLRSGSRTQAEWRRRGMRRGRRVLAAALAAGLLLGLANGLVGWRLFAAAEALRTETDQLARALAGPALGAARGEQALLIARRQWMARRESLAPYAAAFAPSLTTTIASVAETAQRADMTLERLSLRAGGLEITGRGPLWESAEALEALLDRQGYTVRLERQAVPGMEPSSVAFTVTGAPRHE